MLARGSIIGFSDDIPRPLLKIGELLRHTVSSYPDAPSPMDLPALEACRRARHSAVPVLDCFLVRPPLRQPADNRRSNPKTAGSCLHRKGLSQTNQIRSATANFAKPATRRDRGGG